MPIFQTAEYQVTPEAVARVKQAVQEFVHYVEANEPGTLFYSAWQHQGQPTRFTHFFVFENEAARTAHGHSSAVRRFESVYTPDLVDGVFFTDYGQIATNQWLQTAPR
jgi:quinol monooxygenase YgiN